MRTLFEPFAADFARVSPVAAVDPQDVRLHVAIPRKQLQTNSADVLVPEIAQRLYLGVLVVLLVLVSLQHDPALDGLVALRTRVRRREVFVVGGARDVFDADARRSRDHGISVAGGRRGGRRFRLPGRRPLFPPFGRRRGVVVARRSPTWSRRSARCRASAAGAVVRRGHCARRRSVRYLNRRRGQLDRLGRQRLGVAEIDRRPHLSPAPGNGCVDDSLVGRVHRSTLLALALGS